MNGGADHVSGRGNDVHLVRLGAALPEPGRVGPGRRHPGRSAGLAVREPAARERLICQRREPSGPAAAVRATPEGEQVVARIVPHPCQNVRAQTVMGGHSGDLHRRGDLDSRRYQGWLSKPDKDGVLVQAHVAPPPTPDGVKTRNLRSAAVSRLALVRVQRTA